MSRQRQLKRTPDDLSEIIDRARDAAPSESGAEAYAAWLTDVLDADCEVDCDAAAEAARLVRACRAARERDDDRAFTQLVWTLFDRANEAVVIAQMRDANGDGDGAAATEFEVWGRAAQFLQMGPGAHGYRPFDPTDEDDERFTNELARHVFDLWIEAPGVADALDPAGIGSSEPDQTGGRRSKTVPAPLGTILACVCATSTLALAAAVG